MQIFQSIHNLDRFGVPLNLSILQNQTYKSKLGGIVSFTIYLISLVYAIYIGVIWYQGEYLPKIQKQVEIAKDDLYYKSNDTLFKFELGFVANNQRSFKQIFSSNETRYLVSQFVQYTALETNKIVIPQNFDDCHSSYNQSDAVCLNQNELGFELVQSRQKNKIKKMIAHMTICNENQYPGIKCADKNNISDYLLNSGPMTFIFQINIQQFDYRSKLLDSTPKEYFFQLNGSYYYSIQFNLKLTNLTVYEGVLFQTKRTIQYVSDVEVQLQQFLRNDDEYLSTSTINLSPFLEIIQVQYVTLGEIIAQVGSIISVLLLVRHGVIVINKEKLNQFIEIEILKIYYPELNKKKIFKNLIGRIKKIDGFSRNQTSQFLQRHKKLISSHLSFIDNQRRMAIMQWAVFHLFPKEFHPILSNQGFKLAQNNLSNLQQTEKILTPHPSDFKTKIADNFVNNSDIIIEEENYELEYFKLFKMENYPTQTQPEPDDQLKQQNRTVTLQTQNLLNFFQGRSLKSPRMDQLININ